MSWLKYRKLCCWDDSLSVQKVSVWNSICSSFAFFSFSLVALLLGLVCHVISGQLKTTHRAWVVRFQPWRQTIWMVHMITVARHDLDLLPDLKILSATSVSTWQLAHLMRHRLDDSASVVAYWAAVCTVAACFRPHSAKHLCNSWCIARQTTVNVILVQADVSCVHAWSWILAWCE